MTTVLSGISRITQNRIFASRRPRIFSVTMVSELTVGAHVGGAGALMYLLSRDFALPVSDFALLGSIMGVGMVVTALLSPLLMKASPDAIFYGASIMVIMGALLLAFGPSWSLVMLGTILCGLGISGSILIIPVVLQGPRRARDLALANGASSAASIATPLLYGFMESLPWVNARWSVLVLIIPCIVVLLIIRKINFKITPSAYAERWLGRRKRRRKDLSDAFPPVATVQAFGGPTQVSEDELGRATMPSALSSVHVTNLFEARKIGQLIKRHGSRAANRMLLIGLTRVALASATEAALYAWGIVRLINIGVPTSTAAFLGAIFPLGISLGRFSGSLTLKIPGIFQISCLLSIVGTIMIGWFNQPLIVVAGLAIAGLGTALLYPITIDDIFALPGLSNQRSAALGVLSSGAAIFATPMLLPVVASIMPLGMALLTLVPLTLVLMFLPTGR
ncbi:MFS transporter [Boudabousia marimammalium]|uniref:Major facilitator superfamily (MFS) profile domain-containing protein n=1 Tax=Boudabousia marimammalium TaxID=156892 RepID=A0A1Q5PJ95_9ACTO|nr:MFS transporter [Boudabousia marimammalium]OKL45894.1 hypothetical protein BM477_07765 [Boudabousia marimammalium]